MEITDKFENVQDIEDHFGTDSIELLIHGLSVNLELISILRKNRLWDIKPDY